VISTIFPFFGALIGVTLFARARGARIDDYVKDHVELKTALTKWGGGRTGFQM
jgi:ribulose 1,5-bisphosphate carboxylase large subunit-like protein